MLVKKTGGQYIVDVLAKEKVSKIFGVPGESYLYVLDALYKHDHITYISTRHEGGAAFMAEGYAKASGEVGVCMATRGPGATNLSIGIHTARQDSTPLVALIGQVERTAKGREAFQEIDYDQFFGSICKWTIEINEVDRIPELLHRAFHIARAGRPGPVLVSLPEDMLQEVTTHAETYEPYAMNKVQADDAVITEALEILKTAKKPVVIAGGGVIQANAAPLLEQFVEKAALPVVTGFRRFTAFRNNHDHYIGSLGMGVPRYLVDLLQKADVVLALGTRFSQMTTTNYTLPGRNTRIIHVDISPDEIGKVYHPHLSVLSDMASFLNKAITLVAKNHSDERREKIASLRANYEAFSGVSQVNDDDFVDLEGLMYDLKEIIPADTILTSDAGNFFTWLSRYYQFNHPDTYVGPTSGAMGYGIPSALGVKVAKPNRTVISFSGDGGAMMTIQEFETAVRNQIPIIAIVINNGIYGTIRAHQERTFPNRVVGTQLTQPDFATLAKSLGGRGIQVSSNEAFRQALTQAIASGEPYLIEVISNPDVLAAN